MSEPQNLMKELLSTVADSYDSVRPGAGDCVRKMICGCTEDRPCDEHSAKVETMDLRIPVTVVMDLFIDNVPVGKAEQAIEALRSATIDADLENAIAEKFDFLDCQIVSSTRWNPVDIKDDELGVREHAESGSFRAFDLKADTGRVVEK